MTRDHRLTAAETGTRGSRARREGTRPGGEGGAYSLPEVAVARSNRETQRGPPPGSGLKPTVGRPQGARSRVALPETGAAWQRSTQVDAESPFRKCLLSGQPPNTTQAAGGGRGTSRPRFHAGSWLRREEAARSGVSGVVSASGSRAPQRAPTPSAQHCLRRQPPPLPEVLPAASGLEEFGKCARGLLGMRAEGREAVPAALGGGCLGARCWGARAAAAAAAVPRLSASRRPTGPY